MRIQRDILLCLLAVASGPAFAQAQAVATPYLHVNFGDVERRRGGVGLSAGYSGSRLGFEFDVDRHQHFFKDANLESPNSCVPGASTVPRGDSDTDAWIVMGNVIAPIGGASATTWRPYATAGLGVIRAWIDGVGGYHASQTNVAFNVGGGVLYRMKDGLALRGDVRHFRALVDDNKRQGVYFKDYAFWRTAFGVTFGWSR